VDYAHDNNFEAFVILVGKCVNNDGNLRVSYASPGLLELLAFIGTLTEEFIGFTKTQAL
ncbi:hypothetical protein H0H87_008305, partial [Tephrocybe sp. NHM501043]